MAVVAVGSVVVPGFVEAARLFDSDVIMAAEVSEVIMSDVVAVASAAPPGHISPAALQAEATSKSSGRLSMFLVESQQRHEAAASTGALAGTSVLQCIKTDETVAQAAPASTFGSSATAKFGKSGYENEEGVRK
ncbi:unnamed protein product [Fusarium venenatum]|uniref:Uncharacterized protein n=1 Tax=Fusarium venenatum TaxID=56646 RepID=A0A2L2T4B9_9HYPO|nr:uncharacterized protein FVRRES_13794 [Fusarium venenatum]CEI41897.1 unnamed protein product [Fusarium venenatum]